MTDPKHTDTSRSDHARGCEGRNYSCTCGYDDATADRIEALEAENEWLRETLALKDKYFTGIAKLATLGEKQ